jgi:hypothetical protein
LLVLSSPIKANFLNQNKDFGLFCVQLSPIQAIAICPQEGALLGAWGIHHLQDAPKTGIIAMALTDVAIRSAKPKDKPYRMSDSGGLYIEISPAGGKLWRLKYRFDGKEKRLALGAYPDTSLKDARDKRDAARKLLAAGVDPSEQKKAAKAAGLENAANSFEVIAREWFAKQSKTWAESHSTKIMHFAAGLTRIT